MLFYILIINEVEFLMIPWLQKCVQPDMCAELFR